MVFGTISLLIISKLYNRSIKDILHFYNPKSAFLIYAVPFCLSIIYRTAYFSNLTISLLISKVILQQFATCFFEEGLFRGLLLEGAFHAKNNKWYTNLIYGLLSFIIFGSMHVLFGWDLWTFFYTGTIGFAFAAIFLLSHNLIYPMLLHFIYDIFDNIAPYSISKESSIALWADQLYKPSVIFAFIIFASLLFLNTSTFFNIYCWFIKIFIWQLSSPDFTLFISSTSTSLSKI
ncbi:CPBP family intramembrane glutamic endopeptidase [Cellulosilyticum ruminicola]|uniref:CPBP family intramembrane glutamic endopeptidase n=1 Tax=Cellulosilyticum ruminicola TaxID=425254 RepID=UPI0038BA1FC7